MNASTGTSGIMRHLKTSMLLAIIAALIAFALVVRSAPVQIAYHDFQMQRVWHKVWDEPDAIVGGFEVHHMDADSDQFEYHKRRLVELGAVHELKFQLKNIMEPSDESKHFSKFLQSAARPNCIDFVSPCSPEQKPMQLTVWCYAHDVSDWKRMIVARDVVGYRTQFMGRR